MKLVRMADFSLNDSQENRVNGLACVFNQDTNLGWFTEEISPRAFDNCDMSDVVLNFNHNNDFILARTTNGSLKLDINESGLFQEAQIVDTTLGRDVLKLVQQGLINKMSFSFSVSEDGKEWSKRNGKEHRVITKIKKLYDVSLVTFPAYSQTFAYARNEELANLEIRRVQKNKMEVLLNGIK